MVAWLLWLLAGAASACLSQDGTFLMACIPPPDQKKELCLMAGGCASVEDCDKGGSLCCQGDHCNRILCYKDRGEDKEHPANCFRKDGCAWIDNYPAGCFEGSGQACTSGDFCNDCKDRNCQTQCQNRTGHIHSCDHGCSRADKEDRALGKCAEKGNTTMNACFLDRCNTCDKETEDCIDCYTPENDLVSCPKEHGCALEPRQSGCFDPDDKSKYRRCYHDRCNACGSDTSKDCMIGCFERDGNPTKCKLAKGCSTFPPQNGCGKEGSLHRCFTHDCNEEFSVVNCTSDSECKAGARSCCLTSGGKETCGAPSKCNQLTPNEKSICLVDPISPQKTQCKASDQPQKGPENGKKQRLVRRQAPIH